jgi:Uma2 family endonuclease
MSAGISQAEPTIESARTVVVEGFPELESGDRMNRQEFHRRYEAMPQIRKAELVEGVVYVPSPIRFNYHSRQHGYVLNWVGHHAASTPGVDFGGNPSVFLDDANEPQPDGVLFIQPEFGGRVKIDEKGYIVGAPDLAAEVAASSVSYDLHDKLKAYARNGVREYVVWRVYDRAIDWLFLSDGKYEPLTPAPDGILRSRVFPGLWLDSAAMVRGDLAAVLRVVQQGLSSPEHAEFAAGLKRS